MNIKLHRLNTHSFLCACIALLFAGETQTLLMAQGTNAGSPIKSGSIDLTAYAGVSAVNANEENAATLRMENHTPFGGRVAYNFDLHHAVEFSLANPLSFYADYLYHFSAIRARWVPYLTAGIGGSRYGLELGEQETGGNVETGGADRNQTALTGNFGGGIKYVLNKRFALRLDVRDLVGRYNAVFANVPGASNSLIRARGTSNDIQFTAGVVVSLHGR
jgi:hypothetical protein